MLHVLFLRYTGGEHDAEPYVSAHVEFLDRHHHAGTFLVSGRTEPSSEGGVIVARGIDRTAAESIAAEDPFVVAGVAAYTIVTLDPARAHPSLVEVLGADPATARVTA